MQRANGWSALAFAALAAAAIFGVDHDAIDALGGQGVMGSAALLGAGVSFASFGTWLGYFPARSAASLRWLAKARGACVGVDRFLTELELQGRPVTKCEVFALREYYGKEASACSAA